MSGTLPSPMESRASSPDRYPNWPARFPTSGWPGIRLHEQLDTREHGDLLRQITHGMIE
jgi:hypothetical protein